VSMNEEGLMEMSDERSLEARRGGKLDDGVGLREEKTDDLPSVTWSDEHDTSTENILAEEQVFAISSRP
jgi:hypothetical protein